MKKNTIILSFIFAILAIIMLIVSIRNKDDILLAGKVKVRLQLQWFDQAQFAGFYAAKYMNFYNEEGLDVVIIPGGYNTNPIQLVLSDTADIGLVTGNKLLVATERGQELKAIGNVFNTSIACFMSMKSANITKLSDLKGRKIAVYRGFDTEHLLYAFLLKANLRESDVTILEAGPIAPFIKGEIDLFPSYRINEPILMRLLEIDVRELKPEDFQIQFLSDTIFCRTSYWQKNRDILERFIRASAKGWQFAKNNIDETINIMYDTRNNLTPDATKKHQTAMLEEANKYLLESGQTKYFVMSVDKWMAMEAILKDIDVLKSKGFVNRLCDFGLAEDAQIR